MKSEPPSREHTKGPWTVAWADREHHDDPTMVFGADNSTVCEIPGGRSEDGYTEEIDGANARLIAASPDLLAGVIEWIADLESNGDDCWCTTDTPDGPASTCPPCFLRAIVSNLSGGRYKPIGDKEV